MYMMDSKYDQIGPHEQSTRTCSGVIYASIYEKDLCNLWMMCCHHLELVVLVLCREIDYCVL